MSSKHTVQSGDCISSIAAEHGFFPDTIWDHPENAALKQTRKAPNVLASGDVVYTPDRRVQELERPTEKRHRFKRIGVPDVLRLQMLDHDDQPIANRPYFLDIDGATFE